MLEPLVQRLAAAGCVYPEAEAAVLVDSATGTQELEDMVRRREAGAPLEHVVGWVLFRGQRLDVDPGVFVPRARSELLVEQATSLVRCTAGAGGGVVVLDLCCGTGAIGVALAAEVPAVRLHAADVDPAAVACARRNVSRWGGVVHEGDLFAALPRRLRRRVDVLVASPPYVPSADLRLLPGQARDFEPPTALLGGSDGLALVSRIARRAGPWLAPGGALAIEVAEHQLGRTADLLEARGYAARTVTS
ncbi:putative protein N(5)-glutamine methyltransferase, partial [Georgenia sp. 311]|uniref:putative protein N(5)-glutamine methyltransferase n=1 Tax=Georgenia sp. 311 TaxID=2585134 RepID=UPI00111201B7